MNAIDAFFLRRKNIVLSLSAGKDSAACLHLLKPYWPWLTVVWVNPGNPYPETLEYMAQVADMVPNFVMVCGTQKDSIASRGWPVDILPIEGTATGKMLGREDAPNLRLYTDCCLENLWQPMAEYCLGHRVDGIIRGQKLSDNLRSPIRSGHIQDGVEYLFPIEGWEDDAVVEFLGDLLPPSYARGIKTSLDCMNCTAYLRENKQRVQDLKTTAPEAYAQVQKIHLYLRGKVQDYSAMLEE